MLEHYLGQFEEFVLRSVAACELPSYGGDVHERIQKAVGHDVSVSSVYTTLHRSVKKGYLEMDRGDAASSRGGRAKTFFRITEEGHRMLKQTRVIRKNIK